MALNFHGNGISSKFQKPVYSYNVHLKKFKNKLLGVIMGAHSMPEIGRFFQIDEIQHFLGFLAQVVKKLQLVFI